MTPDRERIEREADAVILAWYHNDTHDRTHVEPESRSGLVATVAALVHRERAAALEMAASRFDYLEDVALALRALAAQERAT